MQTKQHLQLKHHLLQDKTHKLTFSNVVAEIWRSLCLVTDLFVKGEGWHHGEQHQQNGCNRWECYRASYVSTCRKRRRFCSSRRDCYPLIRCMQTPCCTCCWCSNPYKQLHHIIGIGNKFVSNELVVLSLINREINMANICQFLSAGFCYEEAYHSQQCKDE